MTCVNESRAAELRLADLLGRQQLLESPAELPAVERREVELRVGRALLALAQVPPPADHNTEHTRYTR